MAKSFVADLRVAKISKAKEEEKPVKKPPARPLAVPKKSKIQLDAAVKKKESSPEIKIEQSIDVLDSMNKNPYSIVLQNAETGYDHESIEESSSASQQENPQFGDGAYVNRR